MAISQTTHPDIANSVVFTDTDSISTPAAVKASSGTIYFIDVDNSLNAAVSYLKLYFAASGDVTAGTTAPDMIIAVPASSRLPVMFSGGMAFSTALSSRTVTAGGTAGTTNPTSDVTVRILYV